MAGLSLMRIRRHVNQVTTLDTAQWIAADAKQLKSGTDFRNA
mgnify:CR=1 FL=1